MANKKNKIENNKKNLKIEEDEIADLRKKVVEVDDDEDEYDDEEYDDEEVNNKKSSVVIKEKTSNKSDNSFKVDWEDKSKLLMTLVGVSVLISLLNFIFIITILVKVNNLSKDDVVKKDDSTENNDSNVDDNEESTYDVSMFTSLTADELTDIFSKKDGKTYVVNVGNSDCPYSNAFLPSLQQSIKDYNYTLYYIGTETITSSEANKIIELSSVFSTTETSFGRTPITYAIKNGKVIDSHVGYTEYDEYQEFLESLGIKKR